MSDAAPTAPEAVLRAALEQCLDELEISAVDHVVVAFSGGPDSTALLGALAGLPDSARPALVAAHVDHGLDDGSADRADEARRLASALLGRSSERDRFHLLRLDGPAPTGESPEAWARRERYAALDQLAGAIGARWIFTAHHAGDQVETVLLRMLYGTGLRGLGGIEPRLGPVVRPFLDVPRAILEEFSTRLTVTLERAPVVDPSNRDPQQPRARVRHALLPSLGRQDPEIDRRVLAVRRAARGAFHRVDALLHRRLDLRVAAFGPWPFGATLDLAALRALPKSLWTSALALLHRAAGVLYPAPESARRELHRQLDTKDDVRTGVDCGDGWTWRASGGRLRLERSRISARPFTYTFDVPGAVDVPEFTARVGLRPHEAPNPAPWMLRGAYERTGLGLPRRPGRTRREVTIRNRRPGDRIQPLGSRHHRRLKDLFIDRKVPRSVRDRLPLLLVDGIIAWVPGVTVDERFRLPPGTGNSGPGSDVEIWVADIRRFEGRDLPQ